jgi:hypothetical protein
MATPDTEALGGTQKEKISERSCGITKTHRRILPCMGAVIICENNKARRKRAFSRLLLQNYSYHAMSDSLFRKISQTWNCIHKKGHDNGGRRMAGQEEQEDMMMPTLL